MTSPRKHLKLRAESFLNNIGDKEFIAKSDKLYHRIVVLGLRSRIKKLMNKVQCLEDDKMLLQVENEGLKNALARLRRF